MLTDLWNDANGKIHPASVIDYLPQAQLHEVQLQRLRNIVSRAYERVDLYRNRLQDLNVTPDDIKTLDDIGKLPFTVKSDLRDSYPFGMFASPKNEIVRLHASSGTTGKPIVVAYTKEDLDVWSSVMMRTFASCGLSRGDIIQNAYGYGLFTGGLGAHYGAEALGAMVVPISGGGTDRQIMIMKDFGVTAICCTPSYFTHIIERAAEMGVDMNELPLRAGIFGAEPWTDAMRKHIEANTKIKAYDIFGLSEIIGPGVGSECSSQNGLHIFEDHFYPEIIDPDTLDPVPEGEDGELVLTTLSKRAMPMIRYRTRDITSFIPDQCACGRSIRRIKKIISRSDDMFIIRGVNVFPSQIEAALLAVEGTLPQYKIVLTRAKGLDQVETHVEVTPEIFSDKIRQLEEIQAKIEASIKSIVGISAKVRLVEPNSIERSLGKAKRIEDNRDI